MSTLLRKDELETHVSNGTFRLAFVGMSNAGKTYRSRTLQEQLGFLWYHVDEEIRKALGFSSFDEMAPWLGYPSSPHYPERERIYLDLEDTYTKYAAMKTGGKNLVFDTTGSVIHLPQKTLDLLRENCLVVHLDTGDAELHSMIEKFFMTPKPVAWSGHFNLSPGESELDALKRCYPALLSNRLSLYRKLSHINIPAQSVRDTSAQVTLKTIQSYLP